MSRRIPPPPTEGHVVIIRQVERPGHKAKWDGDERRWTLSPEFIECEDDIAILEGDEALTHRYKRAGDKITARGRTFLVVRDAVETYDFGSKWATWTILEVQPYYATDAEVKQVYSEAHIA